MAKNRIGWAPIPFYGLYAGPGYSGGYLLSAANQSATQAMRPIVLDLGGNGIKTTSQNSGNGVLFDVDNDGFAEQTDWVDPQDGMLLSDFTLNI